MPLKRKLPLALLALLLLVPPLQLAAHHDDRDDAAAQEAPGTEDTANFPGYNVAIDLGSLLAPPPANGSAQTKAEIEEVLRFQQSRSMQDEADIKADSQYSVFRFADVMGGSFSASRLPKTAALFEKVVATSKGMVGMTKGIWDRPRPFQADSRVVPCVKRSKSSSYPSSHATAGTVMAVVLANLVPEKKEEIFARGWLFALHRVMGGVHQRSDIEAGRIGGTVLASHLFHDPEFLRDFAAAKAELRPALGLAP
jgi:acid phosphatase (class A)